MLTVAHAQDEGMQRAILEELNTAGTLMSEETMDLMIKILHIYGAYHICGSSMARLAKI
jgi:hypothetical protein